MQETYAYINDKGSSSGTTEDNFKKAKKALDKKLAEAQARYSCSCLALSRCLPSFP